MMELVATFRQIWEDLSGVYTEQKYTTFAHASRGNTALKTRRRLLHLLTRHLWSV